MEIFAATIDPCHQCVWRATFIQRSGIEEPQEKMPFAGHHKNPSRRAQWIIQAQRSWQPISVVSSLAGRIDRASDFAWVFVNVPAVRIKPEVLCYFPQWEIRVPVINPFPIGRFLVEIFFASRRSGRPLPQTRLAHHE